MTRSLRVHKDWDTWGDLYHLPCWEGVIEPWVVTLGLDGRRWWMQIGPRMTANDVKKVPVKAADAHFFLQLSREEMANQLAYAIGGMAEDYLNYP